MFVCSMDSVELVYPALLIDEVDYYWNRLSEGGDEAAQHVGWLKDKYGFSWQIAPIEYYELIQGPDLDKSRRVMDSILFNMTHSVGDATASNVIILE